jgi:PAS domain S-box-containing protein
VTTEPRKTGIGVLGDAPWGTHACLFYDTGQDLLDTVIPYLKTGLEEQEFCLWVISEPLTREDAVSALRRSVPDLDRYLMDRSLELIPYADWYLEGDAFDLRRSADLWADRLEQALARGCAGMRATGDTAWLERCHKASFHDYECQLNAALAGRQLMVLCTYPLPRSSAAELLDLTRAHQVVASLRHGEWELIETPELRQGKEEIRKLNQQLEQKVIERTQALRVANEELRREIAERKQAEEELRAQKEVLQKIFDHIPVMINFVGADGRIKFVNGEWERTLGWTLEEIRRDKVDLFAECYPAPEYRREVDDFIARCDGKWVDFKTRVRDGRVIDTSWVRIRLSDGTSVGLGRDITHRKQAEEQLKATSKQLQALSASLQSAREEERTRMARLIHDEFGSTLTSLKWDLEGLAKILSEPVDPSAMLAAHSRIVRMIKLTDSTMATVKRVAWELRPGILDDLGLVEAIEWQAQQFQSRSGITCQPTRFLEDVQFTKEQATAVFRIFQEALTNILRHAQATNVDVTMTQDGAEFVLTISDNGKGITWIEKSGLGILGMQERARLVGGKIDIQGLEGAGTTITLRVPLGPVSEA